MSVPLPYEQGTKPNMLDFIEAHEGWNRDT